MSPIQQSTKDSMKKKLIFALALLPLLGAAALKAEGHSALYLLGGIDGKMLTNQDANNYFNLDNGQLGPQGYGSPVAHLGFQFERWFAIEASADLGPVRTNDVSYQNGILGTTRHIVTRWALSTYSITPGVTWVGRGFVNMLGLRIGQANLSGHVQDDAYGSTGSYDQEAQAYDGGVVFRSSQIMAGHVSIGLEFGYDWTMFNNISNKNGSGSYGPAHSPERNVSGSGHNGDQTTLDFSGGHVALTLGLWSNAPGEDAVVANPAP